MFSFASAECWRDPPGGTVFSSRFQGAPLSKDLHWTVASSTSPWSASPRRQLPRSSPLQDITSEFTVQHLGKHSLRSGSQPWREVLPVHSFLGCSVSAKKTGISHICSSCILLQSSLFPLVGDPLYLIILHIKFSLLNYSVVSVS